MFDVDRLYGTARGYRHDLSYTGRAEDHVTSATPRSAPLNEISFRYHLQLLDAPAHRALAHVLKCFARSHITNDTVSGINRSGRL